MSSKQESNYIFVTFIYILSQNTYPIYNNYNNLLISLKGYLKV